MPYVLRIHLAMIGGVPLQSTFQYYNTGAGKSNIVQIVEYMLKH